MIILKMSLSAAFLIMTIMVIRILALHKLPKRTFLALWGVVLCRLVIPVSFPSRFSVYTFADILNDTFGKTNAPFAFPNATTLPVAWSIHDMASPDSAVMSSSSVSLVTAVWIIGMLACILFFLMTHLCRLRDYKAALPIDNEFVKKWLHEHPIKRKVAIRQSDKISAPLTYGIFRPVVLLPKETDWTDGKRLCYIFTHEYVHIRRFDILSKYLLAASLCVHWFNPFVWVMFILANRDIELSCDETVVRTFGETMKSEYALTLIELEEKKIKLTPLVNNFSKYAIEERINAIMKMKRTTIFGTAMTFTLVLVTILIAFVTPAAAIETDVSNEYDIYNPEIYYEEGEAVFIGTAEEQDEYSPYDEDGNTILVKRIIIDEQGEVTAVVPVENQLSENITPDMTTTFIAVNGYENVYKVSGNSPLPYYVFQQINIYAPSVWVAVIPVELQIKNK